MEYIQIILTNFVPMFVILYFTYKPEEFTFFSSTSLGKLFAVLAIIYFTHLNYLHGLLVCLVMILFYQSNHIHLLRALEGFAVSHTMTNYSDLYEVLDEPTEEDASAKETFKKEHCENNQLMYKNYRVRPESTSCVFPEIKFQNRPCNVCEGQCRASVLPVSQFDT